MANVNVLWRQRVNVNIVSRKINTVKLIKRIFKGTKADLWMEKNDITKYAYTAYTNEYRDYMIENINEMATAQGTPESDTGSFECFQNYTAPEVFIQGLAGIVDQQDVESMIRAQKQMLQRFEKTNEMLTNCNQLSVNRLKTAGNEFKKHTTLLAEMKKDLDYIFKRIRIVKNKLSQQYPQAFNEAVRSSLAEEVIVEDVDCSVKPLEPEIVPIPGVSHTVADRDPDSDVPVEEFQFAKLRKRRMQSNDSSSTESNNEHSNADTSPCTSDTG